MPDERFFEDAEALPLLRRAGRLKLRDDGLDERDGEGAGVRQRLRKVVELEAAALAAMELEGFAVGQVVHVLPDGRDAARHPLPARPQVALAHARAEEEDAEEHALLVQVVGAEDGQVRLRGEARAEAAVFGVGELRRVDDADQLLAMPIYDPAVAASGAGGSDASRLSITRPT